MFDIKKVKQEAEKELHEERMKKAKEKIKFKLSQIEESKKIVRNFEREYQDLIEEISQEG